jgi:hypothetical protein
MEGNGMFRSVNWVPWARGLSGAAGGSILAFIFYEAGRLPRVGLAVGLGALIGLVLAVVLPRYVHTLRLVGVVVNVPHLGRMNFSVTKGSQHVAWQLFVEGVTRVASQPLAADSGVIREALTSLYGLFAITRETLKETQPSARTGRAPTVEHLAFAMLNAEIRPFLSRWHPDLLAWEAAHPNEGEEAWPGNSACRAALAETQERLIDYMLSFGELARVPNARQIVSGTLNPRFAPLNVLEPTE